jgi:hypothetical protein
MESQRRPKNAKTKHIEFKNRYEVRPAGPHFTLFDTFRDSHMLYPEVFDTFEEASAFLSEHLSSHADKDQKTKLKTMNDISAADAAKLFHMARNLHCDGAPMDDYCLYPDYFPRDIAARDFLQCLGLYSRMFSEGNDNLLPLNTPNTSYAIEHHISDEQRTRLAEVVPRLSDEDLMAKGLTDAEIRAVRAYVDVENRNLSRKQVAGKLDMNDQTLKTHLSRACDKLGIEPGHARRRKLATHLQNKT